jgi:hypothetical protein
LLSDYQFLYYNSDDGVWLSHGDSGTDRKCRWEANLGFFGTLDDALRAAVAHEMEAHGEV